MDVLTYRLEMHSGIVITKPHCSSSRINDFFMLRLNYSDHA